MSINFLAVKSVLYLQGVLMCDLLVVIYDCFTYAYILYVSVLSETGNCCIHLFLPYKTFIQFALLTIIITKVFISWADVLNDFGI